MRKLFVLLIFLLFLSACSKDIKDISKKECLDRGGIIREEKSVCTGENCSIANHNAACFHENEIEIADIKDVPGGKCCKKK